MKSEDIEKLETLLRTRDYKDLTAAELELVQQEFETEEEFTEAKALFVDLTIAVSDDCSVPEPSEGVKLRLDRAFEYQHQRKKVKKNGWAFPFSLSWILPQGAGVFQTGFAMGLVAILFALTTQVSVGPGADLQGEGIYLVDTAGDRLTDSTEVSARTKRMLGL